LTDPKQKPAQHDLGYRHAADLAQHGRRRIGRRHPRDLDQPLLERSEFEIEHIPSPRHRKGFPQSRLLGMAGVVDGGDNGGGWSRLGNRLALVPETGKPFHGNTALGRSGLTTGLALLDVLADVARYVGNPISHKTCEENAE
jgi:hypothetical protein